MFYGSIREKKYKMKIHKHTLHSPKKDNSEININNNHTSHNIDKTKWKVNKMRTIKRNKQINNKLENNNVQLTDEL